MSEQKKTQDTFISELAERILKDHAGQLDQVTVVFPNRRAGLFFRQALSAHITKPIWMPEVISMQDFVGQYATLSAIETLEAIFSLYEVYQKHQKKDETFDQFFFWGEMILRDFEEIDQYLVNPEHLFTSIKTQKELDEEFYFLDEEDKRIIQSFWSSFLPKTTSSQEAFLETWKILLPIYSDFKALLHSKGQAYGGMIYRQVAENLQEVGTNRKLYFAGFNALTFTEEKILKHFVREYDAQIIWDLDDYYLSNTTQEAGYFLRSYQADSVLGKTFPETPPKRIQSRKAFHATGVSLEVGQTKALSEHLQELASSGNYDPQRTVVVLPKEHMLFPTLHAVPDAIGQVNITMGYPLKDTPVYSLLESVLVLQNLRKDTVYGTSFYYKPLIELLEHPLLYVLEEERIKEVVKDIKKRNRITLYQEDLGLKSPVFQTILRKPDNAFTYLQEILKELHGVWQEEGHELELEFISRFYQHVTQLQEMMGERTEGLSYDFLIKLFRRLSRSLKIPFTGEPLSGLQVMGILETRNLDFDQVFILNMNEDSWPAAPRRGSFIPFNIRKAFDLPVFDHQDSIYAYLFYRLIQRASKVHFFYNTVAEFNVNGELSRLVQQLEVESGHIIQKRILASPIKTQMPQAITIEKTPAILEKMERYIDGFRGGSGNHPSAFTPSAINTYLDCRLKFYFKYVERLYEPDEVQEEMDPMVFGNILHDSMEILYKTFTQREKRSVVHEQDIFWIAQGIDGAINQAFIKHYGVKNEKKFKLEGRSLIARDILSKFIRKILDYDKQYAPFEIIGLEADSRAGYVLAYPVSVNGATKSIRLKGIIDRLDIKEGKVRVIDYKTGRDEKRFGTVEALVDREDKQRKKAVFQVFFYSYLFMKKYQGTYESIEPGLFNSRDLFSDDFEWRIDDATHKTGVNEFRQYTDEFEASLTEVLTEMYNAGVAFDQTTDEKKCGFCPYREICGR